MSIRITAILAVFLIVCARQGAAETYPASVQGIVDDPDITYQTSFRVECGEKLWNRILDSPQVWDKLWRIYHFKPHFTVVASGTSAHITDPKGPVGDLTLVSKAGGRRVYLGQGALHHPKLPQLPLARMALIIDARNSGKGTSGTVALSLQAEGTLARTLLKSLSGPVTAHVGRMTDLYIQAFEIIISDASHHPYGRVSTTDTAEAKEVVRVLFQ